MKIPQELVVLILVGGLFCFILIAILSGRKNKSKDPDNNKKSNSKWFLSGRGKAMDQDKLIFCAVLGTIAGIVAVVRFIGWRKVKKGREGE